MTAPNLLYYGDNLPVLRQRIQDETADLIYLDPPFNSGQQYNAFLPGKGGKSSASQQKAFKDSWTWDPEAERAYGDMMDAGGAVANTLRAMRTVLENKNIMAYLVMMAPRLIELKRVLKTNGSIYLHCDPTAGHYLKVLMDSVFGANNFRSEIIWRRSNAHNKTSQQYGPVHDTIFFYTKGEDFHFQPGFRPYANGYVSEWFTGDDGNGPFRTNMLTGPGTRKGSSGDAWHGFNPTSVGRHWAIPASLKKELPPEAANGWSTQEVLDYLNEKGHIYIPRDGAGQPKYVQRIGAGVPYQDVWGYQPYTGGTLYQSDECIDQDVKWLGHEREDLGYPTQKPEGLLARILHTSSNRGDTVLDPFCGCGTTVSVAERLGRRWIGIDIASFAVSLIRWRLHTTYGEEVAKRYSVIGEPATVEDAEKLAEQDRFKFQWWAVGRIMGVRVMDEKRGADKGIDGRMLFNDSDEPGAPDKEVIFSAKSGKLKPDDVRALLGVITREKADIGVLVALSEPTSKMRTDAAAMGTYKSPFGSKHPKIQIITVAQILEGKKPDLPHQHAVKTFRTSPAKKREPEKKQKSYLDE